MSHTRNPQRLLYVILLLSIGFCMFPRFITEVVSICRLVVETRTTATAVASCVGMATIAEGSADWAQTRYGNAATRETRLQLECSYSNVSGDAFSAWEPINVLRPEGGRNLSPLFR